ncbi:ethylmalonyl-CoA decarboxylase-like [Lytechinus variegatus]|uniref:ethylmalonyl-CoA decarboxylase-like n=1 Tax=Lytechinus variegatus TaxID=7654 RepID=UPI001BB28065|nr:ethylmalonyl-CoA decarboxylase-like [Lytechinus variegatus]XP_041483914.1 ethylmalonyl-CoA decarboxylase-like [Lytechinus variegatus]XP_041484770.1 ethylmalonyl-CoA decarboxylase-like [Lytechinus variegatus]XP_041484771.1 ethylmalonyl-CoA decarboxylase-like [Lytechinus variegatus]
MRSLVRLSFPLVRHYCNRGIPYKTEATHSGVNLTETTPSYRMDQSIALTDTSTKHSVFNEQRVRVQLAQLGDGSVDLVKDDETGVARIVLNNPSKGNALSGKMMVDFSDVVDDLEVWENGKGVVLHGSEECDHFCSGGDVSVLSGLDKPEAGGMMCLFMQNTLSRLQRLPMISVAHVHGQAIGGGAELLTACDFRLWTESTELQFKQAKLGLSPGWGGGARLVGIVGPQRALQLLAGCQKVTASEALEFGLATEVLPRSGDSVQDAAEWLSQYTQPSVDILSGIKELVLAATHLPLDKALKVEREIFTSRWWSSEHEEGFKKVLDKLQRGK